MGAPCRARTPREPPLGFSHATASVSRERGRAGGHSCCLTRESFCVTDSAAISAASEPEPAPGRGRATRSAHPRPARALIPKSAKPARSDTSARRRIGPRPRRSGAAAAAAAAAAGALGPSLLHVPAGAHSPGAGSEILGAYSHGVTTGLQEYGRKSTPAGVLLHRGPAPARAQLRSTRRKTDRP